MPDHNGAEPLAIIAPDILPYQDGGTGVPFVHTFRSTSPGPHVVISALVHGNEICGAIALDQLFNSELRPKRGTLTLMFCNVDAYARFDPSHPARARFVDEDFNRVWSDAKLIDNTDTSERHRAREILPFIEDADYLLDLHSMYHASPALTLCGIQPRGQSLAAQLGTPSIVISDKGHAAGPRMRDYGPFSDPNSHKTALLVECGQHWTQEAVDVATHVTFAFLAETGIVDAEDIAPYTSVYSMSHDFFEVTHAITVQSQRFSFVEPLRTMDVIADAGTPIAFDDTFPIATPYDDCLIVMPSMTCLPGNTAVRLAKRTTIP